MRVQLLAAALGLALLSGLGSPVVAQETVPISEGASIECPSEEMMDDMAMSDEMMDDAMMEDDMMEDDMMEGDVAQCPKAEPKT